MTESGVGLLVRCEDFRMVKCGKQGGCGVVSSGGEGTWPANSPERPI